MSAALTNLIWLLFCLPESLAFRRATMRVSEAQQALLLRLLRRNIETQYGQQHGFASIRSVADYQARVPLTTYDDYRGLIEQIGAGQPAVLTADSVQLLEPTSGSTAPTKYIPYTAALRADFQRGIAPWITDLYLHLPGLLAGSAYWSVTPVSRSNQRSPSGIPIGFEEDSAYFGRLQRLLINSAMAVPPLVRLIDNLETFRYTTLLFLLRNRALALISVWNPTFLILLVDRLLDWSQLLIKDIAAGTCSPPHSLDADLAKQLEGLHRPQPGRAKELHAIFQSTNDPAGIHARIWPKLRLISCWSDANATRDAAAIAQLFPQARLQGKGLIATEGFVSFPLLGQPGAALALRSHFFEFLPNEQTGPTQPLLAHEIRKGTRYSVVLTSSGGLYRYQLHDLVEVVGWLGQCPLVRFLGKEQLISDWFGEKLNEQHVRQALDAALEHDAIRPTFAMLACDAQAKAPSYVLFIEAKQSADSELYALGKHLEEALCENYHYRYCRDLGQLHRLRVFRVTGGAREAYVSACRQHGQRLGDIKPLALNRLDKWPSVFRGNFLNC